MVRIILVWHPPPRNGSLACQNGQDFHVAGLREKVVRTDAAQCVTCAQKPTDVLAERDGIAGKIDDP